MLSDYLGNKIQFLDRVTSWEESLRISAQPLLENGFVQESYIEAIVDNVIQNGNYIILLPEIAMPHARREYGAI